ncbi:hypothetical protein HY612_01240 [Candidatus Roizmanbacteria bacterium]|nr:hypothetical protein [Candidatus Roizmanbacteria bacterium]
MNDLKVYFTAATSYDGILKNNYARIISLIKSQNADILSGEQIVNNQLLLKDKKLRQKQIFERETRLIDLSDCLVAEVSRPSLGVGSEITQALNNHKPVLALVLEGYEDKISPIIAGNPSESLFLEYYNFDKLEFSLIDFFKHVTNLKSKSGKLVIIEGGDGSGKTTQAKLLLDFLKKNNFRTKYLDFPQYQHSFHGETVAKFLRGEFGSIHQVSPYLISLAFALDRVSVKNEMEHFLKTGGIIVSNRYVTSNMAHQSAKFKKMKPREEFLNWLFDLEYKVHKMPKEDLVLYLYVPWYIALKLTKAKQSRQYLKGKLLDIQESDQDYREMTEQMYLYLSHRYKHWVKIDCVIDGKILPRQIIHEKVIGILKERRFL